MQSIERKFQVLLTIALFFPLILDKLFYNLPIQATANILVYGYCIGFLILDYICLEWMNFTLSKMGNRVVNLILLLTFISLSLVFLILAYSVPNNYEVPILYLITLGIFYSSPFLLFITLVVDLYLSSLFKK